MKTSRPTVNLRPNLSKRYKDGTYPIYIHVNWRGTRAKESAGTRMTRQDFDRGLYRTDRRIRTRLGQIEDRIDELLSTGLFFTSSDVLSRPSPRRAGDPTVILNEMARVKRLSQSTFNHYRSAIRSLQFYYGEDMVLDDITAANIQGYAKCLKVSPSTTGDYLKKITSLFNFAADRGYVTSNPLKKWRFWSDGYRSVERPRTKTLKDVERYVHIYNMSKSEAIGVWLAGYYFNGLTLIDLVKVEWEKVKKVRIGSGWFYTFSIYRTKTNERANIMTPVMGITEKLYNLMLSRPWAGRSFNAYKVHIGRELKKIEPGLTYYSCRHTFATVMVTGGAPVNVLAGMMGRSVNGIATYVSRITEDTTVAKAATALKGVIDETPIADIFE